MNSPKSTNNHNDAYHRYHIDTIDTPDIVPWPPRFNVHVKNIGLAKLLLSEMLHYRGNLEVVTSRPCMYGVFSGPVGGFSPRPQYCVGCLRCTTQYPDWVRIEHNPDRQRLGDSYFTAKHVNAATYEAQTGLVPVKGAGYRGFFGGVGWDGMWTDMSEIVRPTRDGIHGREFISTSVDIGTKPNYLVFDANGQPISEIPNTLTIPVPFILDRLPSNHQPGTTEKLGTITSETAADLETLAILPVKLILQANLRGTHIVPLVSNSDVKNLHILPSKPKLIELDGWDPISYTAVTNIWPEALIALRIPFLENGKTLMPFIHAGVRIFHFTCDYHGKSPNGDFIFDMIREAHTNLVRDGIREKVTLLGSGGIIAAEHVPKAIIAGLDAVALDTPLLVALQTNFSGDFTGAHNNGTFHLPKTFETHWGVQRLKNLLAAWRDQMLEILGAMGLREVRRLRGEMGRAMFQTDLEREAFGGIDGYPIQEILEN